MTTSPLKPPSTPQDVPELDEAFLQRVDRAGLLSKQRDPYRMDQVHRALQEEVALAAFGDQTRDRTSRRLAATTPSSGLR